MLAPNKQSTVNQTINIKLIPRSIRQTRLLLVSDSTEGMSDLRNTAAHPEFDITVVSPAENVISACRDEYDVVVLDVISAQLMPLLKVIRMSEMNRSAVVLVEASRVASDLNLAGVLPLYRAMPCSQAEMIALLRKPGESHAAGRNARGML